MAAEATFQYGPGWVKFTAAGALVSGQVVELPNTHTPGRSRAGIYTGLQSAASGDVVTLMTKGVFRLTANTTDAFAVGDTVWWDDSASEVVDNATDGDFILGVAVTAKAGATAGTIDVDINEAISDA